MRMFSTPAILSLAFVFVGTALPALADDAAQSVQQRIASEEQAIAASLSNLQTQLTAITATTDPQLQNQLTAAIDDASSQLQTQFQMLQNDQTNLASLVGQATMPTTSASPITSSAPPSPSNMRPISSSPPDLTDTHRPLLPQDFAPSLDLTPPPQTPPQIIASPITSSAPPSPSNMRPISSSPPDLTDTHRPLLPQDLAPDG